MRVINKDITTITSGVIIHQVNCQNAMGAGVAKALYAKHPIIKSKYHELFERYTPKQLYGKGQCVTVTPQLKVINSFTQFNYGKGKHTNEDMLINIIRSTCRIHENSEVYIPYKIGCSLGGGNWNKIVNGIKDLDITIVKL